MTFISNTMIHDRSGDLSFAPVERASLTIYNDEETCCACERRCTAGQGRIITDSNKASAFVCFTCIDRGALKCCDCGQALAVHCIADGVCVACEIVRDENEAHARQQRAVVERAGRAK